MRSSCYLAAAALLGASLVHAAPLLGPTDFVIAIDTDVVAPNSQIQNGEEVNKVIDGNIGTNYLNVAQPVSSMSATAPAIRLTSSSSPPSGTIVAPAAGRWRKHSCLPA